MFTEGDRVEVRDADAATLRLVAATDFRTKDPAAACERALAAADRPYARLRSEHEDDHRSLFRRVALELAEPDDKDDRAELPTDVRLDRVRKGESDPALVAQYFQFGRYLLISSSRPGTMPANLQGIWNESLTPPWESKYTININTQMNYWPAEVTNLAELHEPLFDLIEAMRPRADRRPRPSTAPAASWRTTTPTSGRTPCPSTRSARASGRWGRPGSASTSGITTTSAATATSSPERAYPVMKEAAEFLLDYLVDDGQGRLVTGPSISPENRYRTSDGTVAKLCMGPTMDVEIAHALFGRVVEASELLGVDPDFRRRVAETRRRLPRSGSASTASCRNGSRTTTSPTPATGTSRTSSRSTRAIRSPCGARRSWRGGADDPRAPAGPRGRPHRLEPRLDHQLLGAPRGWRTGA